MVNLSAIEHKHLSRSFLHFYSTKRAFWHSTSLGLDNLLVIICALRRCFPHHAVRRRLSAALRSLFLTASAYLSPE